MLVGNRGRKIFREGTTPSYCLPGKKHRHIVETVFPIPQVLIHFPHIEASIRKLTKDIQNMRDQMKEGDVTNLLDSTREPSAATVSFLTTPQSRRRNSETEEV